MKLKHALAAAVLAFAPIVSAAPSSSAVGVAVGVHPGHYCWRHACWRYRWHGGYYNYILARQVLANALVVRASLVLPIEGC
jgi:hypothetical protein